MRGKYRKEKIERSVLKEVSTIIKELKDPHIKGIISVSEVKMSADMKIAYIYISTLSEGQEQKDIISTLNHASGYIRHRLGKLISTRYIPVLRFFPDNAIKDGMHVFELFKKIEMEKRDDKHT